MLKKLILGFGLILVIETIGMAQLRANPSNSKEYEVKAVFLFNFTNFIRWPEGVLSSSNNVIKLCVVGDDPFGALLDAAVGNEKNAKHSVVVQRLKYPKDDLTSCHILFVSRSEQDNYSKILPHVAQKPILTIGETDDFLAQGGMIEFYILERRVRLAIALQNLRAVQLSANANLLKVAKLVD
jgi:hypothetical protein